MNLHDEDHLDLYPRVNYSERVTIIATQSIIHYRMKLNPNSSGDLEFFRYSLLYLLN